MATQKSGEPPLINLPQYGYFNVLGKGEPSLQPMVKAKLVLKRARKKIKEAGGVPIA
ncbi:hypothetical protein AMTRI_Chr09g37910 [Amborella trichopoda]